jgi:ATP-dependent protease Clp ATPase subunit
MRIRKLRCSFCRKTEDQVSKLVAGPRLIVGPRLYICNECVAIASLIMQGNPPPTPAVSRSLLQEVKERWRHFLQRRMMRETSVLQAP